MSDHYTLDDLMGGGGHTKRPDHPDFWLLSEILLELKASMAEHEGDLEAQEKAWREAYEILGDFDSIAYHAIQAAIQTSGIGAEATGPELQAWLLIPERRRAYVQAVQTFFDGFKMGAEFVLRKEAQDARDT